MNHARRVEKALASEADAVILDLEDAIAVNQKISARDDVVAALSRPRSPLLYVRINDPSTTWYRDDLTAVVRPGLDGVVLPKVSSAQQVAAADDSISKLERQRHIPAGALDLIPIIETASAISDARAIAGSSPRVKRLAFGAADLSLEVGFSLTREEQELSWLRMATAIASRAAGREPPIDTVWFDLDDARGLADSVARARALGFQGKLCVHPSQLAVVNQGFLPTDAEVKAAKRIATAFRSAEAEGLAAIQVDGRLVDYPIARRAERLLEMHSRFEEKRKSAV